MGIGIRKEPPKGKKYAILIGVGEFKDRQFYSLKGVPIDITNFAEILRDSERTPYEVVDLLNAGLIDARKAVSDICSKLEEEDILFFYYSGHGALDGDKTFYMIFNDSEHQYLDATCLESEYILSQFRKSKCKNFVVIVDACYSGAFFNNIRGLPKGLVTLTSCEEDQVSFELPKEGGVFTNILVTGIKSEYIDANRDGRITFSEIFDYVVDRIQSRNLIQRPQKWEWNIGYDMCLFDSPKPVFISYKREQKEFVSELSEKLNAANISTFVDQEKIRIGDNWKSELEKTIKNARVFLMVMDQAILCSEVSNWELEKAFEYNIPILPIVVEDVEVHAMYTAKYGHINRLEFNHAEKENSIQTIIDHIRSLRIANPSN